MVEDRKGIILYPPIFFSFPLSSDTYGHKHYQVQPRFSSLPQKRTWQDNPQTCLHCTKGKLGDWRKRKNKEQPFFHVRTNGITHESHLLFSEKDLKDKRTITNPDSVTIHPMHPETELFRYTYATFYDCILETDREFGLLMKMLKDDGVLDDTFVFYFGDNGGSLPGTKGYTNELGLNVPLIVYVPKKWRYVVSCKPRTHCDAFVSFVVYS